MRRQFALSILVVIAQSTWLSAPAGAASMPAELIGTWCDADNSKVTYTKAGYNSSADGEYFGCEVRSAQSDTEAPNKTWTIRYFCSGEFGTIQVKSLIAMMEVASRKVIAVSDSLNRKDSARARVSPIYIMAECGN